MARRNSFIAWLPKSVSEILTQGRAKGARPPAVSILDFKIQIRSGQPRDEWDGVAGAAVLLECAQVALSALPE
jgi:hypothetical protein